jgi:hypothetical protein
MEKKERRGMEIVYEKFVTVLSEQILGLLGFKENLRMPKESRNSNKNLLNVEKDTNIQVPKRSKVKLTKSNLSQNIL